PEQHEQEPEGRQAGANRGGLKPRIEGRSIAGREIVAEFVFQVVRKLGRGVSTARTAAAAGRGLRPFRDRAYSGRLERHPAIAAEIGLSPRMGVALADEPDVLVLARAGSKAGRYSGRDALG